MSFQDWGTIDIPSMFGPRFDRINIFCSSPEHCTQCKFQEAKEAHTLSDVNLLSVKRDDFFPFSNCEHCFWTGYFTSRPERVASSSLLAARQIKSLIDCVENFPWCERLQLSDRRGLLPAVE
jgi:alpha-mannosidase